MGNPNGECITASNVCDRSTSHPAIRNAPPRNKNRSVVATNEQREFDDAKTLMFFGKTPATKVLSMHA